MHDVTLVILNSLRIKCHIRRPLKHASVHVAKSSKPTSILALLYWLIIIIM